MKQAFPALYALGVLAFAASPHTAHAAATDWQVMTGGRVRLVIADPKPGEQTVRGMLQVDLEPGWKTYWRDPGDAGVPLQIELDKSDNAALASVDFPAPERFDDGVTVWAGYKHPVAFGLTLTRSDAAKPMHMAGNAFLGICEAICVPVQFNFDVTAADAPNPTVHQELVSMALGYLPAAADATFGVSKAEVSDKTLAITATLPEASAGAELFLAPPKGIQFAAPVLKDRNGASAAFEAQILMQSRDLPAGPQIVAYTIKTPDKAVSGTVELTRR